MKERIKKLNCLYLIADIIETPNLTLEEIFSKIVAVPPSAMNYPENVCARIKINQDSYTTTNFHQTEQCINQEILFNNKVIGNIQICNLLSQLPSNKAPFLKEELSLTKAIAERLGKVIERIKTSQNLSEKIIEIEKINKFMVDRELKMVELKEKIIELEQK